MKLLTAIQTCLKQIRFNAYLMDWPIVGQRTGAVMAVVDMLSLHRRSFTAEQKRQFDAFSKGFRSLSEEQTRLSRELRDFMRELSQTLHQAESEGEYSD